MNKIVIGLVGPMVSGKGDVGKYLKRELGFIYESLSDRVREEADARGVERFRENLVDIGNDLRETNGNAVLAKRTIELLYDQTGNVVLDGVRNPGEIDYLRREMGALIFGIDAPQEKRLEWYLDRAEERGEDSATEEDFYRADSRDYGVGEADSGQQVGRCLEMADCIIYNDGSKKQMYEGVEYFLIRHGFSPEGARRAQEKK
jgi:dephospho-CoA kinase